MTLRQKLTLFTPIACRLLARRRGPSGAFISMTDTEICRASGLPMARVKQLSWMSSWDHAEVGVMLAFTRGCGVDIDDRNAVRGNARYLRQGTWTHILRSSDRGFYRELIAEWNQQKELKQ